MLEIPGPSPNNRMPIDPVRVEGPETWYGWYAQGQSPKLVAGYLPTSVSHPAAI